MPKFVVSLDEDDGNDLTGRSIEKTFERDFLPEIRSFVLVGNKNYEVICVDHDLDVDASTDRATIVHASMDWSDFDSLRKSDPTWIFYEARSTARVVPEQ